MSKPNWEEDLGQTQYSLDGLYIPPGKALDSPKRSSRKIRDRWKFELSDGLLLLGLQEPNKAGLSHIYLTESKRPNAH